ncbi:uncharacterized protein [Haliotis asinina]|uniref:uncharacterized protein n=1 Tax=Haliotis asinina TaxID=109174 RepID=UPI003531CB89
MWLTLGARLTLGAWLLVWVSQVMTANVQSNPLNISCITNGSINVLLNTSDTREIFVLGSGPGCSDAMRHFTLNSGDHLLNTSCKANNGYILQVLDFSKPNAAGFTLTVNTDSCQNSSQITTTPAKNVSYLEEVVLPTLHMAILPAKTDFNTSMTASSVSSMYLGQEVMLTIYNDRSQGRASYMLVPTLCEAYPADNRSVRLTLLQQGDNGTLCTKQNGVIGQFTIDQANDFDVAWAPLYGFKFASYPDSDLIIECTVLVCSPHSSRRQRRCGASNSCYIRQDYNKRRKRFVSMPHDIVHAEAGLTARTRIKLKQSLASSGTVTTVERLLLFVTVMAAGVKCSRFLV